MKEGQYQEEEILDNNENSFLFNEFLAILGDTVVLKGKFSRYVKFFRALSHGDSQILKNSARFARHSCSRFSNEVEYEGAYSSHINDPLVKNCGK